MRRWASACSGDLKRPETPCLTFAMRVPRPIRLSVNGTTGPGVNRGISVPWRTKAPWRLSAPVLPMRPRLPVLPGGARGNSRRPFAGTVRCRFPTAPNSASATVPAFASAHLSGGPLQRLFHEPGPGVAVGVDDEPEIPRQVGAAEGVVTVFAGGMACPAVMDGDPAVAWHDIDGVHGPASALRTREPGRRVTGAAAARPSVPSVHPHRHPVDVRDRRGRRPFPRQPFPAGVAARPAAPSRPAGWPRRWRAR